MRPVIIIFGAAVRSDGTPSGAMRTRVTAALATGRPLADPLYMPTGGQGRYGRPEAEVMAGLLEAGGVAHAAILPEPTARNTFRSAVACAHLLGQTQAPVYAVTSGYHLFRCILLLRIAGLRARPGRMPPGPASSRRLKRWFWRLRELPAIPIDVALMLLERRQRRVRPHRGDHAV